ncbi:MAG: glutamate--tRNA ligase, partial [Deltaproteobacteria bacterium]|nr:glutamate--tRNA ligase [Deltaproteobacteria bacterium]
LKKNILKHEGLNEWFPILADRFETLQDFTMEETENVVRDMADEYEIKAGILINGARAAVTGQAVGPGIFDVLLAVGQDRVVERLRKAVTFFE